MNAKTDIYLVKHINGATGNIEYRLVKPEYLGGEGEPTFDVDGVSIFNILSIEPYGL